LAPLALIAASVVAIGAAFTAVPRAEPKGAPLPILNSLEPGQVTAGGPGLTLRTLGANFLPVSEVRWNGAALPTTFLNRATLDAAGPAAALASAGTATIDVVTAIPGPADTALTSPLTFTITGPSVGGGAGGGGPPSPPVLTALSPAQARVGTGALSLRV